MSDTRSGGRPFLRPFSFPADSAPPSAGARAGLPTSTTAISLPGCAVVPHAKHTTDHYQQQETALNQSAARALVVYGWNHINHDPLPRATAIFFGVCVILAIVVLAVAAFW
jgi:hypothetical protein